MPESSPGPRRTSPSGEPFALPERVTCPFCNRPDDTELHSPFGPQLSVATYWCRACRAPFDYLKWRPPAPDT